MDGAVWGFIGVVIGGLITGIVTLRAESIRADKEAALDGTKRTDDRQLALDEFQRVTLLDLQDAVIETARVAGQIFLHDLAHFGQTGKWERSQLNVGLDEASRAAHQRISTLKTRVADNDTRALVESLLKTTNELAFADREATANWANNEMARVVPLLMERSGALIRATFMTGPASRLA